MDSLGIILISITGPVIALGWMFLGLGIALIVGALSC